MVLLFQSHHAVLLLLQGRTVDFKKTIIIMTSNLGGKLIYEEFSAARARLDSAALPESEKADIKKHIKELAMKEVCSSSHVNFKID